MTPAKPTTIPSVNAPRRSTRFKSRVAHITPFSERIGKKSQESDTVKESSNCFPSLRPTVEAPIEKYPFKVECRYSAEVLAEKTCYSPTSPGYSPTSRPRPM